MSTENKVHTTLVLVLSDGSHRTMQWYGGNSPSFAKIILDTAKHLPAGTEVAWAFLACGRQHTEYTANEVKELTENLT